VDESTPLPIAGPSTPDNDPLTDILRRGARSLLAQAIEAEVAEYLDARAHLRDQAGRRQVVPNGHLPERTVLTGLGPVEVKQPRVRDRRPAHEREGVHLGHPAALPAKDQEPGRPDPLALPQGRQHRRLHRRPGGPARPRRTGALRYDGDPAEGRLGGRVRGLEPAVAGGQALRLLPANATERQLWLIWIGYLVAYAISAMARGLMIGFQVLGRGAAGPERWDALIQYPTSAVLSGLAFFMMGSGYWGLFYVLGVTFFALALLMPLSLTWAPLEFGVLWAVALLAIGCYLRRARE